MPLEVFMDALDECHQGGAVRPGLQGTGPAHVIKGVLINVGVYYFGHHLDSRGGQREVIV